jgi:sugar phosphate isomerase/epimerase
MKSGKQTFLGTTIFTLSGAIDARKNDLSGEEFIDRELAVINDLDIDQLELHFDAEVMYPGIMPSIVDKLHDEYRHLVYSLHLPYNFLDISCPLPDIRKASVDTMLKFVRHAEVLNPISYVVHITGNLYTSFQPRLEPLVEESMLYAEESLAELCSFIPPYKLLVENLSQVDFSHYKPLVDRMGLSICQDIGHNMLREIDPVSFTLEHAPQIRQVHLHDTQSNHYNNNVKILNDHQPLDTGIIDFERFFISLAGSGFAGSIVLEVIDQQKISASITRARQLMYTYLIRYPSLIAGKC